MVSRSLQLIIVPERLAVVRLEPHATVPSWVQAGSFVSVTRTKDELSIVCPASAVPANVSCEGPFSRIQVRGPLAFSETGVLVSLALPLSEAGISLFALSTYETDHILITEEELNRALEVLEAAGHQISVIEGENGAT